MRERSATLLGREKPELPTEVLFSDIEIAPLRDCAKDRKQSEPDNLGDAVLTTAKIGWYLNRKNDPVARVKEDLGRIHPSGGDGTDL